MNLDHTIKPAGEPPDNVPAQFFELETWLKGIERFFNPDHLPLSPYEKGHAALKNYIEELRTVRECLSHLIALTTSMLGEEKRDFANFIIYLEGHSVKPSPRTSPNAPDEKELALAIEKFRDLELLIDELLKISYISLRSYLSLGRILIAAFKNDRGFRMLIEETLKPIFDAVNKQNLQRILDHLKESEIKTELQTTFVELFKGLRYIDYIKSSLASLATFKRTVVIFSLIKAQLEDLMAYIRRRIIPRLDDESVAADRFDSLIFSTEMELKKVMEVQLVDVLLLRDPAMIKVKLEDAQGILRDLFQQNIIALAGLFAEQIDGRDLFHDYETKLEQSMRLRKELWDIVVKIRELLEYLDPASLDALRRQLNEFRAGSMRYLMYKDWNTVERFLEEIDYDDNLKRISMVAHKLEIYMRTLVREISKRAVLIEHPFRPESSAV